MNIDHFTHFDKYKEFADNATNPRHKALFLQQAENIRRARLQINKDMLERFWRDIDEKYKAQDESNPKEDVCEVMEDIPTTRKRTKKVNKEIEQ